MKVSHYKYTHLLAIICSLKSYFTAKQDGLIGDPHYFLEMVLITPTFFSWADSALNYWPNLHDTAWL